MKPGPAILDELMHRIVQSVRPVRIILFGSSARGEMGPNSDLDVLWSCATAAIAWPARKLAVQFE